MSVKNAYKVRKVFGYLQANLLRFSHTRQTAKQKDLQICHILSYGMLFVGNIL